MKPSHVTSYAKKHAIRKECAAPDFFEGALLGNGNLGVVACTRPDGMVLYFGHNDIWDIRIDEGHKDKVGTFDELWSRMLREKDTFAGAPWHWEYNQTVKSAYNQLYPRPYPASALYLFFDRKEFEVLGHELEISCGLLTVTLARPTGERCFIRVFVAQDSDTLFCDTVDAEGLPVDIFYRMRLIPHNPDAGLPPFTVLRNGFRQILPYNDFGDAPRPGVDKGFTVFYQTNGEAVGEALSAHLQGTTAVTVQITHGYCETLENVTGVTAPSFETALATATQSWQAYWSCSGIRLDDEFLEHIWYINTYFMRCAVAENGRCPGLFANWMFQNIGTAWHGDYHMNYNTQQPFWGLMAANRQALHMSYVGLAEHLLPVSKAWAKDFYKMDGACFPHSAYPVPMTVNPYPGTDWGWEIFETPWTVQSLWWHYTYTKDVELLRTRLYPLLREAALFLVQYMTREGSGAKQDGRYHLFPTIVPELYGLTNGLDKNQDGIADLTLTKFLFEAVLQAVSDLELEEDEAPLCAQIRKILAAFPAYPTATSRHGEVFISVETEDPDNVIYNVPTNLMPIFPGEDIDAASSTEEALEIAKRSWRHHYNEGGNDLVFYHFIGARLGILNLESFKRHIRYSLMPNQTAADRVTLTGGRYVDTTFFDFMGRMGVWFENFSLYAVITECLLWGHRDTVQLFPNWDLHKEAAFCTLRTKGAFLISAACADGAVSYAVVYSECGGSFCLKNPWDKAMDQHGRIYDGALICIPMEVGEEIRLTPVQPKI